MSLNMFPIVGPYLETVDTMATVGDTSTDQSTSINANFAELKAKLDAVIEALNKANGG